MTSSIKGYVLYAIVLVIAGLILLDIYLIYLNNRVIAFNKEQQEQAERVKVNTSDVMRSLHLLDLSVRSYAFVANQHYKNAISIAHDGRNRSLKQLEESLHAQGYPMMKFFQLRDSIERYAVLTGEMIQFIDRGEREAFVKLLEIDPGYKVWLQYQEFSKDIDTFEDDILKEAQTKYNAALDNTYLLQIILFILTIPTLAYTAYFTNRTIAYSEKLRKSEEEKASILESQNRILEKSVHERTQEILAQNEEITAQNEEISLHNERLMEAKKIIEGQNILIRQKNDELAVEVEKQTQDLKQANTELTEQNSRLEQFAFVITHNLRAPMSRLIGLSSMLDFSKDSDEVSKIAKLMARSTEDLEQIIRDLTEVLAVQKTNADLITSLQLDAIYEKVISKLEGDIKNSNARISTDFSKASLINAIESYMENIFYHLISNAIKYRHPERYPVIEIESRVDGDFVQIDIKDNGLGMDTEAHKSNLFNLYKRFHANIDGRGLGLFLVKTQVTSLGGKIEVESRMGVGSVFSLWIRSDRDQRSS